MYIRNLKGIEERKRENMCEREGEIEEINSNEMCKLPHISKIYFLGFLLNCFNQQYKFPQTEGEEEIIIYTKKRT